MKKVLLPLLLFILSVQFIHAQTAVAGADLSYDLAYDSTYNFTYTIVNSCHQGQLPDSVSLCIKNRCSAYNTTIYLHKWIPLSRSNSSEMGKPCYDTSFCGGLGAIDDNFNGWRYSGSFTIPFKCSEWDFSVTLNSRDSITNIDGTNDSWVEATLDNAAFQGHTSPYFSVYPAVSTCNNEPYTYNHGGVAFNNDSVNYQLIYPSRAACGDSVIYNDSFTTTIPIGGTGYNLFNNPLQCNNTFTFNRHTGQMNFTPSMQQDALLAVLCTFYHDGIKVGHIIRNIQFRIRDCDFSQPTITFQPICPIDGSGNLVAPVGQMTSFSILCASSHKDAKLVIQDNHAVACDGSQLIYSTTYSDSIKGIFFWTPTLSDTGLHVLTFTLSDTVCRQSSAIIDQSYVIPIKVVSPAGVQNINQSNIINLYPNPSTGIINLQPINTTSPITITITDALGRTVQNTTIPNTNTPLNISTLPNGIYFIHLFSEEINYTSKILLQRQ